MTIDEKAMGATMQIDLGARVKELNLDVATTVTGTGDVDHVNIRSSGVVKAVTFTGLCCPRLSTMIALR